MPLLRFPPALRYYVANQSEMELPGETVNELLVSLVSRYPNLKFHLLDKEGNLRHHFNLFVNGEHIRELKGLDTILAPGDKLVLLASAAGG